MDWVQGKSKFNTDGTPSIIDDLRLYIMGLAALVVVLVLASLVMLLKKYRAKILKLIRTLFNNLVFNGMIRSLTIMYIQLCMSFGDQIKLFMQGNTNQTLDNKIIGLIMFVSMLGYPGVCWLIIKRNREKLEEPQIWKRISNFYSELKLRQKLTGHLFYYPLFLIRRIVFVGIPTFLYQFPSHQVQLLIFLTSMYILFYMNNRPHWDSKRGQVEIFNELMILVSSYHLICFSDFNLHAAAQFNMGYSFVAVIFIVVFVNIILVVFK